RSSPANIPERASARCETLTRKPIEASTLTPRSRCSRSIAAAGATTATVSPGLSALGLIGLRFTLVRPASYQKVRTNAHQFGELRHLLAPLDQSSVPAPAGAACSAIPVSEPTSEKPSSAAVTHKPAAPIAIVG